MAYVPVEEVLKDGNSIYKLVILAARRAAELNNGAPKLVEASMQTKVSTVALEEIRQGKVVYRVLNTPGKKSANA